MASLERFEKRIRSLGLKIEENGPKRAREVALAIDQALVFSTPVDTGTARSNWQVNLDNPIRDPIPAHAPGMGGNTGSANAQIAQDQGQKEIARFKGEGEIYISNALPYIGFLNEGSSPQAPSGFVEKAVEVGRSIARNAKVLG